MEFSGAALTVREIEEPSGMDPTELGFPVVRQTGTGTQGNIMVSTSAICSGQHNAQHKQAFTLINISTTAIDTG